MTKAVLIIWIGIGQSQVLDITPFDSIAECEAARSAIEVHHKRLDGVCVPYETDQ